MSKKRREFKSTDQIEKKLGKFTIEEMDAMSGEELDKVIVDANSAMLEAKQELDANDDYIKAKNDVSILSTGKREIDSRQKARIQYALVRKDAFGAMSEDPIAFSVWRTKRAEYCAKAEAQKAKLERELKEQAPGAVVQLVKDGKKVG